MTHQKQLWIHGPPGPVGRLKSEFVNTWQVPAFSSSGREGQPKPTVLQFKVPLPCPTFVPH